MAKESKWRYGCPVGVLKQLGLLLAILAGFGVVLLLGPVGNNDTCSVNRVYPAPTYGGPVPPPQLFDCALMMDTGASESHNRTANATALMPRGGCGGYNTANIADNIVLTYMTSCNTVRIAEELESMGAVGVIPLEAWTDPGWACLTHFSVDANVRGMAYQSASWQNIPRGLGFVYDFLEADPANLVEITMFGTGRNKWQYIIYQYGDVPVIIGSLVIFGLCVQNAMAIVSRLRGFIRVNGLELSMAQFVLWFELVGNGFRAMVVAMPYQTVLRPRYVNVASISTPFFISFVTTGLLVFFLRELNSPMPRPSKFLGSRRARIIFFSCATFTLVLDQVIVLLNAAYVSPLIMITIHLVTAILFQLVMGVFFCWYSIKLLESRQKILVSASTSKKATFDERLWESVLLCGCCQVGIVLAIAIGLFRTGDNVRIAPREYLLLAFAVSFFSVRVSTYKIRLFKAPVGRRKSVASTSRSTESNGYRNRLDSGASSTPPATGRAASLLQTLDMKKTSSMSSSSKGSLGSGDFA